MKALGVPLRRPVGTAAAYAGLLLLGLAAVPGLPLGLAPDLEYPRLSVTWAWPNASPETVEALVTSRIEGEAARLRGAREVSSNSGPGWGWVDVSFERGTDVGLTEVVLRERLSALRDELPRDLPPPVIDRSVPEEMDPGAFFVLQVTGDRTPEALRALLDDTILPRLAGVAGVSGTSAWGGGRPEIRVDLDPGAVERGLVDPGMAADALDRVGTGRSLGTWRRAGERVAVALERPVPGAANLRERTLERAGVPLTLASVAVVSEGWESPRTLARLDGRPSVQGVLEREAGTNVLRVAGAARAALGELEKTLPPDVSVRVIHDESESIRKEILTLARRAGWSLVLIFLVVVVARRSVRQPLAILSTVLFSAVVTFLLFRFAGLGINLVTLSGIALAFGMAVDNSIVLLENIALRAPGFRRVRTLAAVREVLFPLLAATTTTAVVMIPFLNLSGDLRDYYLPFVLAVVLSLVASLGVALTLTPLLARWALGGRAAAAGAGVRAGAGAAATPGAAAGHRVRDGFDRLVRRLLARPWLPVIPAVLLLAASLWVFENKVTRGSIFSPEPDTTLSVNIGLPPGAEIARTDALLRSFEDAVLEHEFSREGWVEQVDAFVREDRASLRVKFHPAVAQSAVPAVLKEELTLRAASVSGAEISVLGRGPGFSRGRSNVSPSYSLRLRGPDYLRLDGLAESLAATLGRNPRIRDVDTNGAGLFVEEARELALVPDRARLDEVGLTMAGFVEAVTPALSSDLAARELAGPDGEIIGRVRYAGGEAMEAAGLMAMLVRTAGGVAVPVGDLATLEDRAVPGEIRRRDQRYERTVTFEYRGPGRVGDRFVKSLVENTELPPGYTLEDGLGLFLTGAQEKEIGTAVALSLALVAMVSAALFESLLLPFVALLAVPLSFAGIPFTFWATGESFDRTAYVGLILLAGIAVNNALLLVHRAGRVLRNTGDPLEAARRAAVERAAPIVLTTATSVVGLLPLVFDGGAATSGTWRSLALSATAGLSASAVFTLLVIPCLFVLLARRKRPPRLAAPALPIALKGDA
jgi:HAE1 family hydrophobic/amphiphilic exporter-1